MARRSLTPSAFLVDNLHLLPEGRMLDLAMGQGRNAIYLARRGFDVDGVDIDSQSVDEARASAMELGAPIRAVVGDLEDGSYILPLETYTVEQAAFGKPKNPAHLLEKGELKQFFHGWEQLAYREFVGPAPWGGQRAIAGIVARKP